MGEILVGHETNDSQLFISVKVCIYIMIQKLYYCKSFRFKLAQQPIHIFDNETELTQLLSINL